MAATSFLKGQYKDGMSMDDGLLLALKAIVKTMDTTKPKPEKSKAPRKLG